MAFAAVSFLLTGEAISFLRMEPSLRAQEQPPELRHTWRMWQLVWGVWLSFAHSASESITSYISPILKESYGFSQKQLALLSALTAIPLNFSGYPAGLIFDKCGPQWCLLTGALCVFVGHGAIALLLNGNTAFGGEAAAASNWGVWWYVLCFSTIYWFQATLVYTGSFISNIATFSKDRGAILIVEEGLGGAILAAWYVGFFRSDTHLLLIFSAIVVPVVSIGGAIFVRKPTLGEDAMPHHGQADFALAYAIVGLSLLVFLIKDISQNFTTLPDGVNLSIAVFGICVCGAYAAVPYVPCRKFFFRFQHQTQCCVRCCGGGSRSVMATPEDESFDSECGRGGDGEEAVSVVVVDDAAVPLLRDIAGDEYVTSALLEGGSIVIDEEGGDCEEVKTDGDEEDTDEGEQESTLFITVAMAGDPTLCAALCGLNFWLVILVSMAMWGVFGMISSNAPQIYRALNHGVLDNTQNALYTSVMSVCGSAARIAVAVGERSVANKAILLAVGPVCVLIGCVIIAVLPVQALVFGFACASFGMRVIGTSRILVMKQLYTGANFATINNSCVYSLGASFCRCPPRFLTPSLHCTRREQLLCTRTFALLTFVVIASPKPPKNV